MKVLEARDLNFRYSRGKKQVLRDVNLQIKRGEFVGIVGPSGSGKSTLCLAFTGIIPHLIHGEFKGSVIIRDPQTGAKHSTLETPPSKLSPIIGLVLQNPESQLFNMTVEEEVAFPLENLGLPPEEIEARVRWALKTVGLDGREEEFPPNLSGGEQQRLVIASVLAMKPSILVLDEPTAQLDPVGRKDVLNLISELNEKEKITVILVDHHTDFLFKRADRILVMNDGRILMEGRPRELAERAEELREVGIKLPAAVEVYAELKKRGLEKALSILPREALFWRADR